LRKEVKQQNILVFPILLCLPNPSTLVNPIKEVKMKTKKMVYLSLIILCGLCFFALPQAMAEVNARFDASKMGDMYDFDPNNPVIPTGDTIKIAVVTILLLRA